MGASEIFPQTITHNPNSRLIAVVGDGEYVVYTAQVYLIKIYFIYIYIYINNNNYYYYINYIRKL